MTYFPLTAEQRAWQDRARAIANDVLAPRAAGADRTATFPSEQLQALRDEGFFGLRADRENGGQGQGLLTTAAVRYPASRSLSASEVSAESKCGPASLHGRSPSNELFFP